MKRELTPVQRQWVEALRSGKYKQAKKALRVGDGFCCLGVLCDLAQQAGVGKWEGARFLEQVAETPERVMQWAGLKDGCGQFSDSSLAEQNDLGKSFAKSPT